MLHRLPGAEVHLVAKTMQPVQTDCGPFIMPSTSMADCPDLDLICIPGGFGIDNAMRDRELIDFVRRQAVQAQYVTSVCTGAFILGAAGLLRGKRATTHWSYHDELARVGATPTAGRVVRDGNLFTGGGVTAGIDFALTIVREIAGESMAQAIQLGLEYDPHPPVDAGSPHKAPSAIVKLLNQRFEPRLADFDTALTEAMAEA